jgi:hypothetical protein
MPKTQQIDPNTPLATPTQQNRQCKIPVSTTKSITDDPINLLKQDTSNFINGQNSNGYNNFEQFYRQQQNSNNKTQYYYQNG